MPERSRRLGPFTVTAAGRLMLDHRPIPLGSKSSEILRILLEADGALVGKDALLTAVWPRVAVQENALQVHISALRRALGEAAGCLVTVRGEGYLLDREAVETDRHRRSIAVLPFANLTGQPDLDGLGTGLADELIGTLSHDGGFEVTGRTAAFRLGTEARDLRTVAHELGVAFVLEGSIRASEARLRITAELIDAATGFQLWAACYDRERGDLLAVEASLAAAIRQALREELDGRGAPSLAAPSPEQRG